MDSIQMVHQLPSKFNSNIADSERFFFLPYILIKCKNFHSSLQLLTSPLIIPPTLEHVLQAGAIPAALQQQTSNAQSIKQENILQGA